jgi:hypothetical protein
LVAFEAAISVFFKAWNALSVMKTRVNGERIALLQEGAKSHDASSTRVKDRCAGNVSLFFSRHDRSEMASFQRGYRTMMPEEEAEDAEEEEEEEEFFHMYSLYWINTCPKCLQEKTEVEVVVLSFAFFFFLEGPQ